MTPRCPHCAHPNRPERKFCGECGRTLDHGCVACGFPNGPADRYCGGCGRRLAGRQSAGGRTLATLEVLDLDGMYAAAPFDDAPPVAEDADDSPLDSGEFRAIFEL